MIRRTLRVARRFVTVVLLVVVCLFEADVAAFASDTTLPAGSHCHWDTSGMTGGFSLTVTGCTFTNGVWGGTYTLTYPAGAGWLYKVQQQQNGGSWASLSNTATVVNTTGTGGTATNQRAATNQLSDPTSTVRISFCRGASGGYPASNCPILASFLFRPDAATQDVSGSPGGPGCGADNFLVPAASWVGGVLAVRFTWNTDIPSLGWDVWAPDPGSSTGTPTMTVLKTDVVDGAPPTTYYRTVSLASLSTLTVRIAPHSSSGYGCAISLPVSTQAISQQPTSTDTGTDGDCGFSLNPFHYLRCLFEPQSSLQRWSDLETTAENRPPLSLVIAGVSYVTDAVSYLTDNHSCNDSFYSCEDLLYWQDPVEAAGDCQPVGNEACDSAHRLDFIDAAGDLVQNTSGGKLVYSLLEIGVFVSGFLLLWARISASFGGHDASPE